MCSLSTVKIPCYKTPCSKICFCSILPTFTNHYTSRSESPVLQSMPRAAITRGSDFDMCRVEVCLLKWNWGCKNNAVLQQEQETVLGLHSIKALMPCTLWFTKYQGMHARAHLGWFTKYQGTYAGALQEVRQESLGQQGCTERHCLHR